MRRPGDGPGHLRRRLLLVTAATALVALAPAGVLASTLDGVGAATSTSSGTATSTSSGTAAKATTTSTTATTATTANPWVPGVGGTMTIGIDAAPTGCNPNSASGDTWADRFVLEPVLPSAFFVDSSDQPTYDAALITQAELQSTSPETVVYTINPKAVWSDGVPVTAADFIYTWEQERGVGGSVGTTGKGPATGPATGSSPTAPAAATRTPATGVTATAAVTTPGATGTTGPFLGYRQISTAKASNGGRTLTVVFKTAYADWKSLFEYLLPAHVLEKTGWDPGCTTLDPAVDLSAGPFVLAQVIPGKEFVLTRNPRWWEQAPALSRIVIDVANGPSQLSSWLANGKIDVALPTGFDEQYLETITSQASLASQNQLSATFLQLELSTTAPFVADLDVRLAVAHAIDRQSLVNDVVGWSDTAIVPAESLLYSQSQGGYPSHKPPPLQVSGQPSYTSTTVPPGSPTATPFPSTADLAASAKLLSTLGFARNGDGSWVAPTGKPLALAMSVDTADPWSAETAADVVRQLDAAGIGVTTVTAPDAQSAGEDLSSGKVDMALLPMHSSPYPSQAIAWYTPLLGAPGTNGSQDWTNFDDPTVSSLLEQASQQLNPVDAAPIYAQVDTALWQQMIALPLFAEPSVLAWSGLTAGVSPNPYGPSLLWSPESWAIRVPASTLETQTTSG